MIPTAVKIIEVGPRDGLQNEAAPVSLENKLQFIRLLAASGLKEIEAGAFVSPKWVPQMADSEAVFQRLRDEEFPRDVIYSALVPNEKGMAAALRAGVRKIAVFTAASESFSRKNTNASVDESIDRFNPVITMARENGVLVRGYVSTAFVCPYEGLISPHRAIDVIKRLVDLGIADISIGDTVGRATSEMVRTFLDCLLGESKMASDLFAMHFHDTEHRALANIDVSLEFGISRFDASTAGLGGCPYAPGASGNVSTNDVVGHCDAKGIATGIDKESLDVAANFIRNVLSEAHS